MTRPVARMSVAPVHGFVLRATKTLSSRLVCAKELRSCRELRLWGDELRHLSHRAYSRTTGKARSMR